MHARSIMRTAHSRLKPGADLLPSLTLLSNFIDDAEAQTFLQQFVTSHRWPDSEYEVFGRRFRLPRLQTWHADPGIVYSYSNNLLATRPWTPLLLLLRHRVEMATGHRFNAVLVNYYRDGKDHVGWHSDDEAELGEAPWIASLTLGATREFAWRSRQDASSAYGKTRLTAGSLLLMAPEFQHLWEHSVPASEANHGRINLTFRRVLTPSMI